MTESVTTERAARRDVPTVVPGSERAMLVWLRDRVRRLPGTRQSDGTRGKMPLGARVLVLKGDADKDLGQVAIINRFAGSLVEISYRGRTGNVETRRKQVSSLIRLQEGLELVMDDEGSPLIQRVRRNTAIDDSVIVSDAEE
jgi:hypothetical protein